jgi:hypothetical protein
VISLFREPLRPEWIDEYGDMSEVCWLEDDDIAP